MELLEEWFGLCLLCCQKFEGYCHAEAAFDYLLRGYPCISAETPGCKKDRWEYTIILLMLFGNCSSHLRIPMCWYVIHTKMRAGVVLIYSHTIGPPGNREWMEHYWIFPLQIDGIRDIDRVADAHIDRPDRPTNERNENSKHNNNQLFWTQFYCLALLS